MAYIPKQKRKSYQPKPVKRFGQDLFYNRKQWRKTSKAMIDHYIICPVCETRAADMTDHVIARPDGADYDPDNLLPMCNKCHNRKRGLESHANDYLVETRESLTEEGLVPVDKYDIIKVLNRGKAK